jgi:hypothetical protein
LACGKNIGDAKPLAGYRRGTPPIALRHRWLAGLGNDGMEELVTQSSSPTPELSVSDLRRDHARVRSLLHRFAHLQSPADRRDAMRLALDLFEVHSELEEQLYATESSRAAYAAIADLMERVELTDPASRLYLARGMELKDALEEYIAAEEETEPLLVRDRLHLATYNLNLLYLRRNLVEEAQRMLRVH